MIKTISKFISEKITMLVLGAATKVEFLDKLENKKSDGVFLIPSTNIEMDASASVIQLMVVLFKNEKLIHQLGLKSKDEYIDIYTKIMEIIENQDKSGKLLSDWIEKKIQELPINRNEKRPWESNAESVDTKLIKDMIKDRDIIKNIIMTRTYGSGLVNLIETSKKKWIQKNERPYKTNGEIDYVKIKTNIEIAVEYVVNACDELFKTEQKIINALQIINDKDEKFHITNKYISFQSKYKKKNIITGDFRPEENKKTRIKYQFHLFNRDKKNEIKYKDDKAKNKRALLANLIQSKDAWLMNNIKETMYNDFNIKNILSIHDAFIIDISKSQLLLKKYNESLKELLHSSELLNSMKKSLNRLIEEEKTNTISTDELKSVREGIEELESRHKYIKKKNIYINGLFNIKP